GIFQKYLASKSAAIPSGMNSRYFCQFWMVMTVPGAIRLASLELSEDFAVSPAVPSECGAGWHISINKTKSSATRICLVLILTSLRFRRSVLVARECFLFLPSDKLAATIRASAETGNGRWVNSNEDW